MTLRKSEKNSAEHAASLLKFGKIVILPTDTVYGFSGISRCDEKDFFTESLIASIKGRAEKKPLIELLAFPEDVRNYTDEKLPDEIFSKWPGPLTAIVKNNSRYKSITGRETTAFRCPGDEWLRKVIELCGAPIYSTSVNRSGKPVLTKISQIRSEFEGEVDLIVEDGDKDSAKPSTIVSFVDGVLKTIRA